MLTHPPLAWGCNYHSMQERLIQGHTLCRSASHIDIHLHRNVVAGGASKPVQCSLVCITDIESTDLCLAKEPARSVHALKCHTLPLRRWQALFGTTDTEHSEAEGSGYPYPVPQARMPLMKANKVQLHVCWVIKRSILSKPTQQCLAARRCWTKLCTADIVQAKHHSSVAMPSKSALMHSSRASCYFSARSQHGIPAVAWGAGASTHTTKTPACSCVQLVLQMASAATTAVAQHCEEQSLYSF